MILDKLLEKKDVKIFIDQRILELRYNLCTKEIKKLPVGVREQARKSLYAKIEELKRFNSIIARGNLKIEGERMWIANFKRKK